MKPRVRIAPSPTGLLHIGTVRTALFNYLFAKKNNGTFILRIEDTDKLRSTKESEENILSGLKDLGIIADECPDNPGEYGPYRQSERVHMYRPYLEQLLKEEKAYYCFCTPDELEKERNEAQKNKVAFRYSGKCKNISLEDAEKRIASGEKAVIRLRVPENREIKFQDIVRGETKQNTKDLTGDMVIAKNLDTPLYNFVVVIDDYLMKITHVIRGEDHLSNTPKQLLVYEAFGWEAPKFAHLPLILNPDKTKLSKRKNPVSIDEYLEAGYIKEAFINFLVLLGWNDGTEQEIYSLKELENLFSLERVAKAGAVFDIKRLDWVNGQYIKNMSDKELAEKTLKLLEKENIIKKIDDSSFEILKTNEEYNLKNLSTWVSHEKPRITKVKEIIDALDFYFVDMPIYNPEIIITKKMTQEGVSTALQKSLELLKSIEDFSQDNIKNIFIEKIQEWGMKNGEVLWPIRAALTGKERSPGAFEVSSALGKEKTIQRIEFVIEKLKLF